MVLRLCTTEVVEWQREAVWWLMTAGSTLSLLGSGFVLLCYLILARPGRNPLASLVALLAAADFGWAATNLLSLSTVALQDTYIKLLHESMGGLISSWPACVAFRGLFQFFAGSTVLWTCCIAYFLYVNITNPENEGVGWYEWLSFHVICWGIPLVDTCVLTLFGHATLERHRAEGLCYPRGLYHILSWLLPITCAFLWNLLLYVAIMIKLRKRVKWRKDSISRKLGFRFSLYLFVFLLSWAPSVFNGVAEFLVNADSHGPKCDIIVLVALSNFLLTSQGLWNGLVYGLSNRRIRAQFASVTLGVRTVVLVVASPVLILPALVYFIGRTLSCSCRCGRSTKQQMKEEEEVDVQDCIAAVMVDEEKSLAGVRNEKTKRKGKKKKITKATVAPVVVAEPTMEGSINGTRYDYVITQLDEEGN